MVRFVLVFAGLLALASSAQAQLTDDQFLACKAAQKFVERRLKAPATARFQDCEKTRVDGLGPGFVVHVVVDAQNSYGALLRSTFIATIMQMPDKWQLTAIDEVRR